MVTTRSSRPSLIPSLPPRPSTLLRNSTPTSVTKGNSQTDTNDQRTTTPKDGLHDNESNIYRERGISSTSRLLKRSSSTSSVPPSSGSKILPNENRPPLKKYKSLPPQHTTNLKTSTVPNHPSSQRRSKSIRETNASSFIHTTEKYFDNDEKSTINSTVTSNNTCHKTVQSDIYASAEPTKSNEYISTKKAQRLKTQSDILALPDPPTPDQSHNYKSAKLAHYISERRKSRRFSSSFLTTSLSHADTKTNTNTNTKHDTFPTESNISKETECESRLDTDSTLSTAQLLSHQHTSHTTTHNIQDLKDNKDSTISICDADPNDDPKRTPILEEESNNSNMIIDDDEDEAPRKTSICYYDDEEDDEIHHQDYDNREKSSNSKKRPRTSMFQNSTLDNGFLNDSNDDANIKTNNFQNEEDDSDVNSNNHRIQLCDDIHDSDIESRKSIIPLHFNYEDDDCDQLDPISRNRKSLCVPTKIMDIDTMKTHPTDENCSDKSSFSCTMETDIPNQLPSNKDEALSSDDLDSTSSNLEDIRDRLRNEIRNLCLIPVQDRYKSSEARTIEKLSSYSILSYVEKLRRENHDKNLCLNDYDKSNSKKGNVSSIPNNSEVSSGEEENDCIEITNDMRRGVILRMLPFYPVLEGRKQEEIESTQNYTGCKVEKKKGRCQYISIETGKKISSKTYKDKYLNMLKSKRLMKLEKKKTTKQALTDRTNKPQSELSTVDEIHDTEDEVNLLVSDASMNVESQTVSLLSDRTRIDGYEKNKHDNNHHDEVTSNKHQRGIVDELVNRDVPIDLATLIAFPSRDNISSDPEIAAAQRSLFSSIDHANQVYISKLKAILDAREGMNMKL